MQNYVYYRDNDQKQYIQVDFLGDYQIGGVMTQGRSDAPDWVTKYEVLYSTDGKHYTAVPKSSTDSTPMVFAGNFDQNTPVKQMFPLIRARWIRYSALQIPNTIKNLKIGMSKISTITILKLKQFCFTMQ